MALSARDRRALIIVGLIVVVAAAALFLLPKGSKKSTAALGPGGAPPAVGGNPTPSPSPSAKPSPKQVLVFSGRDPFDPSQGGGTLAPATPSGGGVSPAGSPGPGPGGGSSATVNGQTVVLVSIFTSGGQKRAQVEVDGTTYTVAPGDSFATNFQLVSIDGTCANFLSGSQPFPLCETANR